MLRWVCALAFAGTYVTGLLAIREVTERRATDARAASAAAESIRFRGIRLLQLSFRSVHDALGGVRDSGGGAAGAARGGTPSCAVWPLAWRLRFPRRWPPYVSWCPSFACWSAGGWGGFALWGW